MPPRAQIRFQAVKIAQKNKDDQMGDDSPQSSMSICQGVEGLPLNQQGVCNGQGAIMANTLAAADVVSDEGMRGKVRHGIL